MSLNYSLSKTINILINSLNYDIMKCIIISTVIFVLLLIYNNTKLLKWIFRILNFILIFLISIYYMKDIVNLNFTGFINNMYFYFFNSIIYLILVSVIEPEYKKTNYIIYGISLINILFSLFMTHYLNHNSLYVLGNIYPMIKFGNIIYILYYILSIIYVILTKKGKHAII